MTKYDKLYSIGEEHLMSLFQIESPRSQIGSRNSILFNNNDSCSNNDGIMHIFIEDKNNYTLMITINELKNTFNIIYCDITKDYDENEFSFNRIPYNISEDWHFQLSTIKHLPFTYNFFIKLYEFVDKLKVLNHNNCDLQVIREIYNIVPYTL